MKRARLLALIFVLLVGALFALPVPAQSQASPIVVPIYFNGSNPSSLISNMIIFQTDNPFATQTATCLGLNGNFSPNSPYLIPERDFRIQFAQSVQVVSVTYTFSYTVPRNATRRFSPYYKLSPTHNELNSAVYQLPGGGLSGTETISYQLPAWGNFAAGQWLQIGMGVNFERAWGGGSVSVSGCNVELLVIPSSPISTPTPTPGPTATPGPPPPLALPACAIIPDRAARLVDLSAWDIHLATPAPQGGLNFPPGASISLRNRLSLDPERSYQVVIGYRTDQLQPDSPLGQILEFKLGAEDWKSVPLFSSADGGRRVATIGAARYAPTDQDGYAFALSYPQPAPNAPQIELRLDYICIRPVGPTDAAIGAPAPPPPPPCRNCEFERVGDIFLISDILGVIRWLLCQLVRFFECVIVPILQGVWAFISSLLLAVVSFVKWMLDTTLAIIRWVGEVILAIIRWFGGVLYNIAVSIANFLASIGVLDFLARVVAFIRDLPTAIGNLLYQFGLIVRLVVEIGIAVVTLLMNLTVNVMTILFRMLGIIPVLIIGLFDGFNTSTAQSVVGTVVCTQQSSLLVYIPCLGFYVLDNTIFQGPAFWLLPLLIGVIALDTILWAAQEIRKTFSKG